MKHKKTKIPEEDRKWVYFSCARKKGFETTKMATRAGRAAQAECGEKMYYYKCRFCGKYHLSRQERAQEY